VDLGSVLLLLKSACLLILGVIHA